MFCCEKCITWISLIFVVFIEVTEGACEIFGSELQKNTKHNIGPGVKASIFTFTGAKVKITGSCEFQYVSKETPMESYFKFAIGLEQMRIKAQRCYDDQQAKPFVPRVVVVGASDTGKSTLCQYLLNFAVRCNRNPMFVDLDCGQNSVSVPGTIGTVMVERPSNPTTLEFENKGALMLHYGHSSPSANYKLYEALVARMADVIEVKFSNDEKSGSSGCIINTCGWMGDTQMSYNSLINVVQKFEANVVVVMDSERLYNDVKKDVSALESNIRVVKLPKSPGVISRTPETRLESREMNFKKYFYGNIKINPLEKNEQLRYEFFPHTKVIEFSNLCMLKIGAPSLPESALPIGVEQVDFDLKVVPVTIDDNLKNRVCSVSYRLSIFIKCFLD